MKTRIKIVKNGDKAELHVQMGESPTSISTVIPLKRVSAEDEWEPVYEFEVK